MHTKNVNTATRESAEQFKTDKYHRYCVTDSEEREDFIQTLFFTPSAINMVASWLRQYSDYSNSIWDYWIIPQGVGGNVAPNRIHSLRHRLDILHRQVSSISEW